MASAEDFKEIYRRIAALVDVIHEAAKQPPSKRDVELAECEWLAEDVLARLVKIDSPESCVLSPERKPQDSTPKAQAPRPKTIVCYHNSDFVSLEEYIDAMRRPAISDEEAAEFKKHLSADYADFTD